MNSSISSSSYSGWTIGTVVLGVASFVLLLLASEFMVRRYVEPKNYFWAHIDVFQNSTSPNVVFGDSIAARGFIGGEGFVNLAVPGESPNVTRLKMQIYFAKRAPGNVAIAFNPNVLKRPDRKLAGFEDAYTKNESLLAALRPRHREQMFGYWMVWLTRGSFEDRVRVPDSGGIVERVNASNFAYARMSQAERYEETIRNVTRDAPTANFRDSPNLRLIEEIVDTVRKRGGTPCLVEFPYAKDYRIVADQRKEFVDARRFLREFAGGVRVKFVDFWDRFSDDRLFLNGSHLNEDGGRRLAPLIIRECFG
jgi:hypothetical protein